MNHLRPEVSIIINKDALIFLHRKWLKLEMAFYLKKMIFKPPVHLHGSDW